MASSTNTITNSSIHDSIENKVNVDPVFVSKETLRRIIHDIKEIKKIHYPSTVFIMNMTKMICYVVKQ